MAHLSVLTVMDVELKNLQRLDSQHDRLPPAPTDTNISMTAASNPGYVADHGELRHRMVSGWEYIMKLRQRMVIYMCIICD